MKKILFVLTVAAMLTACNKPEDSVKFDLSEITQPSSQSIVNQINKGNFDSFRTFGVAENASKEDLEYAKKVFDAEAQTMKICGGLKEYTHINTTENTGSKIADKIDTFKYTLNKCQYTVQGFILYKNNEGSYKTVDMSNKTIIKNHIGKY